MAKNIYDKDGHKTFAERVQHAAWCWEQYTSKMRECRKRMFVHYANQWFEGGPQQTVSYSPQPLNLIDRGISIIAPLLVSKNPRVMIQPRHGTNNPAIGPFAKTLELAMAHLFDEIKLAELTLRPLVIDALFGMGITKTGVMHSHQVEILGYLHDVGQPYCDRVDFDDYVSDTSARNKQEVRLEGNWYRLPEEYVKTCGLYRNYDKLSPDLKQYGSENTRPESVAKSEHSIYELRPTVELCDIWLPDEGVIITIPRKGMGDRIMRTVDWDGPEGGPYDVLVYRYFPDSIIGIPIVYTWLDLNKVVNDIVNKMRNQVRREKNIGIYDLASAEDAENVKQATDGEFVGVAGGKDAVGNINLGGFSDQSFPFLTFLLHQWSQTGPNMDITGGRKVDAPTLGQEQMMMSNAAREIDDMIQQTYEVTKSVSRKLAWFLWTDPLIVLPLVKRVAGIDLNVEYSEAAKEGDFFDYTFDIESYSMMRMNPEMKYQRLVQLVQGIVLPTAQIGAQQGMLLNVGELLKEFARYLGITNLDDWYRSVLPEQAQMNPYTPVQGKVSGGQSNNQGQNNEANNFNNLISQQNRAGQKSSSSPIGATTGGM